MMNQPSEDVQSLEMLDSYLDRLQSGDDSQRESLVQEHPELSSMLDCLDLLERLAPPDSELEASEAVTLDARTGLPGAFSRRALPRDFGPYELLEEIGRGGMGVVYKARQKDLDRVVAIKMILAGHLASPEVVRRFQAEARAAARLRHPHIVPIHEVGQIHGQHYFAMELIEGTSLAQQIAAGPCDVPTAVRIVIAIAGAVEQLHRQGIIHRDLKPGNILIDDHGHPYLTDFGLARILAAGSEMTATGVIVGTPNYMAPEQAAGHSSQVGPAADVYSLGAIFYELLTGRPPFANENPMDTLMDVLSREPPLPRSLNRQIPRGLELICLKCLAKTHQNRYASAGALVDDLQRYARGESLSIRSPHWVRRLQSWARREPALAYRLAAIGLFDLVGWANYACDAVSLTFQAQMTLVMLVWTATSVVCQQFLENRRWALPTRSVWAVLDSSLFLVTLLFLADGAASRLLVGYPLLIAGSGLWFRRRTVWFMTALSLASYGVLVLDFYFRRQHLQEHFDTALDRHVLFALALVVEGAMVAYLVDRVRKLTAFHGGHMP